MITHLRFAATPAVFVVTVAPALGQEVNDGCEVIVRYRF